MSTTTGQTVDDVRARGIRAVAVEFYREFGRMRRERRIGNPWGYFFVAPAVIMYILFEGWPLIRGFYMAFSDYRWLLPETHGLAGFNGLTNWVEMFADETFWRSLGISLNFTLMFVPITLVLSLGVALLISKVSHPFSAGFFRVIAYMPVVLPISVAMMVWTKFFDVQFGYLNQILMTAGVDNPPNWLGSPKIALYAMVIPTVWSRFGSWTLLFLTGLYGINREVYEAAVVDGANGWQQVLYITLPLLKPILSLVLILGSGIVTATVESMTLFKGTGGGPGEAALTTGVYLYRIAFIHGDMRMGYAASMSLFLGLLNMAITGVVFWALRTERS